MVIVRDADQPLEVWRPGVTTRMFVSAQTSAHQLTMFEQWCDPEHGAPDHDHAVEEVLRVLAGKARINVGTEEHTVCSGESVIIPAGIRHAFVNIGTETLHTLAVLAAPVFEARYFEPERHDRRWSPGR